MNWRNDIENAPKDGTEILMYDGEVRVVSWGDVSVMFSGTSAYEYNEEPIEYGWVTSGTICYKINNQGDIRLRETMSNPTHWCEIMLPETNTQFKTYSEWSDWFFNEHPELWDRYVNLERP
jgi:hypothetical protein